VRVAPDDDVYRVNAVWLGPRGLTFPWTARYIAYATWLVIFGVIILIEVVTPLSIGVPPVWEICIATFLTYLVMGFVDHERPFRAVVQSFRSDLAAPRASKKPSLSRAAPRIRVRERDERDLPRNVRGRGTASVTADQPRSLTDARGPRAVLGRRPSRSIKVIRHHRGNRAPGFPSGASETTPLQGTITDRNDDLHQRRDRS
jgi:hypothetical protein